jgi:hypothetical protein
MVLMETMVFAFEYRSSGMEAEIAGVGRRHLNRQAELGGVGYKIGPG